MPADLERRARRECGEGSNRRSCSICLRYACASIDYRTRSFAICAACLDAINRVALDASGKAGGA